MILRLQGDELKIGTVRVLLPTHHRFFFLLFTQFHSKCELINSCLILLPCKYQLLFKIVFFKITPISSGFFFLQIRCMYLMHVL